MDMLGDGNPTMVGLLVFLAAGTLAFCVMTLIRVQGSVKRRAAGIGRLGDDEGGNSRSLRYSSLKAAQRVIEYTAKHYSTDNSDEMTRMVVRSILESAAETREEPELSEWHQLDRWLASETYSTASACFPAPRTVLAMPKASG